MNGLETRTGAGAIRDLIESEENAALARFRDRRFGDRLKARLGDRPAAAVRRSPFRPAFRPVLVALALLTIAAGSAFWLVRRQDHDGPARRVIAEALHGSPGLRAIEFPTPAPGGQRPVSASSVERNILSVLSESWRIEGPADARPDSGARAVRTGPFDLPGFYRILIIDKAVERVFADISAKTKEG